MITVVTAKRDRLELPDLCTSKGHTQPTLKW
jgi:hypothetical protein